MEFLDMNSIFELTFCFVWLTVLIAFNVLVISLTLDELSRPNDVLFVCLSVSFLQ